MPPVQQKKLERSSVKDRVNALYDVIDSIINDNQSAKTKPKRDPSKALINMRKKQRQNQLEEKAHPHQTPRKHKKEAQEKTPRTRWPQARTQSPKQSARSGRSLKADGGRNLRANSARASSAKGARYLSATLASSLKANGGGLSYLNSEQGGNRTVRRGRSLSAFQERALIPERGPYSSFDGGPISRTGREKVCKQSAYGNRYSSDRRDCSLKSHEGPKLSARGTRRLSAGGGRGSVGEDSHSQHGRGRNLTGGRGRGLGACQERTLSPERGQYSNIDSGHFLRPSREKTRKQRPQANRYSSAKRDDSLKTNEGQKLRTRKNRRLTAGGGQGVGDVDKNFESGRSRNMASGRARSLGACEGRTLNPERDRFASIESQRILRASREKSCQQSLHLAHQYKKYEMAKRKSKDQIESRGLSAGGVLEQSASRHRHTNAGFNCDISDEGDRNWSDCQGHLLCKKKKQTELNPRHHPVEIAKEPHKIHTTAKRSRAMTASQIRHLSPDRSRNLSPRRRSNLKSCEGRSFSTDCNRNLRTRRSEVRQETKYRCETPRSLFPNQKTATNFSSGRKVRTGSLHPPDRYVRNSSRISRASLIQSPRVSYRRDLKTGCSIKSNEKIKNFAKPSGSSLYKNYRVKNSRGYSYRPGHVRLPANIKKSKEKIRKTIPVACSSSATMNTEDIADYFNGGTGKARANKQPPKLQTVYKDYVQLLSWVVGENPDLETDALRMTDEHPELKLKVQETLKKRSARQ